MLTPQYSDGLNWMRKLTAARLANLLKITTSYYLSLWFKRPILWGQPVSVSVEPTTSCNLRCPECPSGLRSFTRPTGMLDMRVFTKMIDESYKTAAYLLLYFQGEPYLHPQFAELVSYASKKGLYTATSTNGHYLTPQNARKTVSSGLDRLVISIDGTTQQTYESYRVGGTLDKVLEGTRELVSWKRRLKSKTPYIIFQFLVVKPNEHQLDEIKQLAKQMGVDKVAFKTAQLYDYEKGNPLMPTIEKYSRYKKQVDGTYKFKNKLRNQCWKMWHSTVVTWDGTVVPCCFDKDASYALGSLGKDTLSQVWGSETYNSFRGRVLTSRKEIDICKNCTEGTKVWG